ncbi:hypothetical protein SAMN05216388_10096 [Halorientalis persicus]|uniref:Uncharacterized protein n=1 Tax=Halorientalis persicus TaxID=1367881 RepID=A0A1H8MHZ8_9EURY|nr:hypothetical protein [Halorientalis persicus]SEO17015.1 hypothetical protein SAMN05216388_10096 [Halorientalis persicus]
MDRRHFLVTLGTVAIAGCSSSSGSDQTPNQDPTQTATPTFAAPTEEGTAKSPSQIDPFALDTISAVLGPLDGDETVRSYAVGGFGVGGPVYVGVSGTVPDRDDGLLARTRVELSRNGSQVGSAKVREISSAASSKNTSQNGSVPVQTAVRFPNTGSWKRGTYSADVVFEKGKTGEMRQATTSFNMVAPLEGDDATLVNADIPDSVKPQEQFDYSLTLRNTSDRSSSVLSTLDVRQAGGDWIQLNDFLLRLNIPAQTERTAHFNDVSYQVGGDLEFRLNAIDETYTIPLSE